jgi:uncharacterized protein (TIGR03437 family)
LQILRHLWEDPIMSRSILAAELAALSVSAMLAQQQGPLTTETRPSANAVVASISIPANSWAAGTSMPTARQGPFAGVIGTKIYIVSGGANNGFPGVNEIYDTASNTWSTGAPIPTPRWFGASAVVNNILYAIAGGGNSGVVNIVEAYDPSTNAWSTKTPMPNLNGNVQAAVVNNMIYVIGELQGSKAQAMEAYNPVTNTWTAVTPPQTAKLLSAFASLGATIISAGGLNTSSVVTSDTESYSPATNSWSSLAPIPTARQAGCYGVLAGKLYVAGGDASGSNLAGAPLSLLEAYDPVSNSWASGLPSMPWPVVAPGSAVAGGNLYCFGGSSAGSPAEAGYNYVQIYQPSPSVPAISNLASAGGFGGFPSIAPGTWIEIFGSNLAADTRQWAASDFNGINAPTSLDGTKVSIGGQPAFIDYISSGQVNALVPSNVPTGLQQIIVTTAQGASPAYNVTVNAAEPGLLAPSSFNIGGIQYAVALFTDGAYALPAGAIAGVASRPAKPGDVVTLCGIGFGPVTPTIPAGQVVQELNSLTLSLQMSVRGVTAPLSYDGLAPGFAGLYLFNVTVPNLPPGTAALTFSLGGVPGTQTLYLSIGN